jgi:midasin
LCSHDLRLAGTQDLSQLVLVLADGRFHERDALTAAVRQVAAQRGVCLAFIALDPPPRQEQGLDAGGSAAQPATQSGAAVGSSSLMDMQSVSFGAGGKPVFTRYLDAFPFPYYVVLRDIQSLPATLADLLRQWFALTAS